MIKKEDIIRELAESTQVKNAVADKMAEPVLKAAQMIIDAFKAGNKVLTIGNGGSAADAQHLSTELVGRYMMKRKALPAIALTTDTSALTAISNDYGYEKVFCRQIEALGKAGDILWAMTTSGTSPNILAAIEMALAMKMRVIVMTGEKGIFLKDKSTLLLSVPSTKTPRIQEAHITIGHIICYLVEKELFGG